MPEETVFRIRAVEDINDAGYTFRVPDYQRGYRWTNEQQPQAATRLIKTERSPPGFDSDRLN